MTISVSAPVGRRWRTTNVANFRIDQQNVINRHGAISASHGGKMETWLLGAPQPGPDRQCPPFLSDTIWDFQVFWKTRGVFHIIDDVVDPDMHTIQQMNALAVFEPDDALSASELTGIIVQSFSDALFFRKRRAQLINVDIQGPTASGGLLLGPLLGPLMLFALSRVPNRDDRSLVAGCASAASTAFQQWVC